MTKIIAICGPKGSGKTTLAKLLQDEFFYTRESFATPIKSMLTALLQYQGASTEEISHCIQGCGKDQPSKYISNQTPRYALETLGTEWRQLIDDGLWVNILYQRVMNASGKIVIDDLRFLHEARMLRLLEAIIVRIERDGCGPGIHPAEREYLLISEPITIANDGDPIDMLNELHHRVSL